MSTHDEIAVLAVAAAAASSMTERPGVERIARTFHQWFEVAGLVCRHPADDISDCNNDADWFMQRGLRVVDSPEPGLDVERLARALHAECVMVPAPYRPEGSAHPSHIHTEEARVAAAEYERLREESAET